jgi:hypothetical protein
MQVAAGPERVSVKMRIATLIVCALDAAAFALVALATFLSGSDQATLGLDRTAGMVVTALFLATRMPAIALTLLRRAPVAALVLALAFPAALAAAFVAAVVAFR